MDGIYPDNHPVTSQVQRLTHIYARDSSRCQYCGKKYPTTELSLDHVIPRSQGGRSTWENVVRCCIKCNVKKGGRTPEQAHLHLVVKPHKPKRSPGINIRLADERYAQRGCVQARHAYRRNPRKMGYLRLRMRNLT